MARLFNSTLSGMTGAIGNIVIIHSNGIDYARSKPSKIKAKPSNKQLLVRKRIKAASNFMQPYRSYACKFFGTSKGIKSPYHQAMNSLLNSIEMNYNTGVLTWHYPQISFSKGNLPTPLGMQMLFNTPNILTLSWQNNALQNPKHALDTLQILIAAEDVPQAYFLENAALRLSETLHIHIPLFLQNKTLHVYAAFKNPKETAASNSLYVGSISS